jgi:predicted amidohydrolase
VSGVRVAAVQFAVGVDVSANLATCLRMIEAAADRDVELVVLPAYCNHPEWYTDRTHAQQVACRPGDPFLTAIAAAAERHRVYLKLHVTLAVDKRVTAANLLFDPAGELIAQGDTHVLPGPERHWLDPAQVLEPVIETDVGRLGMYGGGDGALAELPRALALRGAQILLASLSSVTTDDARLHVPVRAAENKTWVIAANAVGERPGADTHGVPAEWLVGAGESAIVGPSGTVVTRAPRAGESVVAAEIEPGWADDKTRPDGSDLFLARRPRLYAPVTGPSTGADRPAAERIAVAIVRPHGHGMSAIEEAADLVHRAASNGADLVVLPELFFYHHGRADGSFLDGIAVDVLSQALDGTRCHAVTSLPDDSAHVGVLISGRGVRGRQLQLHACARHISWQGTLGDRLIPLDLEWGRLVIAVGDDALYPETFRLAALLEADAVAVPCAPAERWELTLGLPERAAEHRLNIVAAAHAGPSGGGAIVVPAADPYLHPGRDGFQGALTQPAVTPVTADARLVAGTIFPARSRDREPTEEATYVVDGHPWRLAGVLGLINRY